MKTTSTRAKARPASVASRELSTAGTRASQLELSGSSTTAVGFSEAATAGLSRCFPLWLAAGRSHVPGNFVDHLLQATGYRSLAQMPQRFDLGFDILRVLRHFAGQAGDLGRDQPYAAAEHRRRQRDDQEYRGQSSQATPLEGRNERGQQNGQEHGQRDRDENRLRPIQTSDHDHADHRAG